MKLISYAFTASLLLTLSLDVNAAILLDYQPDANAGYGWFSIAGVGQQVSERFTLGANATVTSVEWFGFFDGDPAATGAFTVEFFSDENGLPATSGFAVTTNGILTGTDTGLANIYNGGPIYRWETPITPVDLDGGTTYWLGVKTSSSGRLWLWSHSTPDGSNDFVVRYADAEPWVASTPDRPSRDHQAFVLNGEYGAVPEPCSLAIFGIGAVFLVRPPCSAAATGC